MSQMTLYHGTSDVHKEISRKGLQNPYLTNSFSLAEYYAECEVDEVGGKAIVYEVQVNASLLRYDGNAMEEPVSFDDWTISKLEERVQEAFERWTEMKPELVSERGNLMIPATEYLISLETVASCKCEGSILPEHIFTAD